MPRSQQLADAFRKLLAEHSTLLSSVSAPVPTPPPVPKSHRVQDFKQFLDGFTTASNEANKSKATEAKRKLKQIERIVFAADEILTKDELEGVEKVDPNDLEYEYQRWYELPEHNELLQMLIDGDSQKFVDCLLGHFEVFAKFIPILDEIFPEKPRSDGKVIWQVG